MATKQATDDTQTALQWLKESEDQYFSVYAGGVYSLIPIERDVAIELIGNVRDAENPVNWFFTVDDENDFIIKHSISKSNYINVFEKTKYYDDK